MPHAALKFVGGVNTNETPTLNENSGISQSNLIRFFYDPNGISLLQKLGGWARFYPTPIEADVRALWAWEDLNLNARLAFGTDEVGSFPSTSQLGVITNGVLQDITPTRGESDIPPTIATQALSASVFITDNNIMGITNFDSVYIPTQVSIGGIVLFGLYNCAPDGILSPNGYSVFSRDQLGNLNPATFSSTSASLPVFATTAGSQSVLVTLPNYTYEVGDTFPVLVPLSVGGITIFGNYIVTNTITSSNFRIKIAPLAVTSDVQTLNGGLVRLIYSFGSGALPPGTGYGIGAYGQGGWGSGVTLAPATGVPIDAVDWTLDNFGEILVACAISPPQATGTPFQPIYVWPPSQAFASVIANAPPVNDGVFVAMPQRQLVAWGSTQTGIQDPLLVSWCDVNNFNQWIPLVINQAGSYRIPKGSKIVGALQGPQQGFIWTDVDCWAMQYIGPPLVYGFNEIGTGCGLIGRKAAGSFNGSVFWMGPAQFYVIPPAGGVTPLPCPIWDQVFQNLDQNNLRKIRFAANSRFGEVQWFYPSASGGTGEVDSYVKYNTYLGVWDYGTLGRSAWVDQSVLGPPVGADPVSDLLFQHEISNDADGQAMNSFFRSGYYSISEGDLQTFVDLVWPDMKWGQLSQSQTANVQITFYVANYPGDTPVAFGPYTVTQATQYFNTGFRGRLVSVQIGSTDMGSFWRTGAIRYRFAPDGKF